jgi:hypothetical protein
VEDLSIIVALNRPGPIRSGAPDSFIRRRRGEEDVEFDHPMLEPLLNRTYGWFLYQEQVINYFSALGYDLGDADAVRKMLGKKDPEAFNALIEGLGEWEGKGYLTTAASIVGERPPQDHRGHPRVRQVLLQQGSLGLLRGDRLPHAVREVEGSGGVHHRLDPHHRRRPQEGREDRGFIGEGRRMGIEVLPPRHR